MGGFICSFWDWLVYSPLFVGSCISIINMNCMYNIAEFFVQSLDKSHCQVLPLVSCCQSSGQQISTCGIFGHPHSMFSCGVFSFPERSGDPEVLDFIILYTSEDFPEKKYGHLCNMWRRIIQAFSNSASSASGWSTSVL